MPREYNSCIVYLIKSITKSFKGIILSTINAFHAKFPTIKHNLSCILSAGPVCPLKIFGNFGKSCLGRWSSHFVDRKRRLRCGSRLSSWIVMALIPNQKFDPYADLEAVSSHRRKLKTMAKRERPRRERCIKLLTEPTGSENWNDKDWELFDLCMHDGPMEWNPEQD
eukprot:g35287.t1